MLHGYLKYWFSWETLSCWINVHFLCLNCMIYKSGKQNCVVSLWTQNKLNTNENSKRRRIRRLNFCQLFNLAWTVHTAPCCACVPSSTCNLKEYLCPPNILTNNCLHKNSNTDNAAICLVYYVALKTLQDKQSQYYCVCGTINEIWVDIFDKNILLNFVEGEKSHTQTCNFPTSVLNRYNISLYLNLSCHAR